MFYISAMQKFPNNFSCIIMGCDRTSECVVYIWRTENIITEHEVGSSYGLTHFEMKNKKKTGNFFVLCFVVWRGLFERWLKFYKHIMFMESSIDLKSTPSFSFNLVITIFVFAQKLCTRVQHLRSFDELLCHFYVSYFSSFFLRGIRGEIFFVW